MVWTEHRRSRQPTANQPQGSFSHPAQDVDSMSGSMPDGRHQAGSVSEEGVRSQHADAPTADRPDTDLHDEVVPTSSGEAASGGVTPMAIESDSGPPISEPSQAIRGVTASASEDSEPVSGVDTPAGQAVPTANSPAQTETLRPDHPETAPGTEAGPQTDPTDLRVGGLAEVVVGDKRYKGRVGKIVSISDSVVGLKLNGSLGTFYCWRNHVIATTPPASHQPSSPPATPDSEAVAVGRHSGDDRPLPAPGTEANPQSESTELRLGGRAEVVGGDKWGFIGRVGTIVTIDSDNVGLTFEPSWGTFDFPRNHLKAITRPTSHQPSSPPAGSERISSNAGEQWLQSIRDTGPGRVERGSPRWVAGLAIIAAGGALVVSRSWRGVTPRVQDMRSHCRVSAKSP